MDDLLKEITNLKPVKSDSTPLSLRRNDSWICKKNGSKWLSSDECQRSALHYVSASFKIRRKRKHWIRSWNALHWKGRKCPELVRVVKQRSKLAILCQKGCWLPWQLKWSPNSVKIWQSCHKQCNVQWWCVPTRLRSKTPAFRVPKISTINSWSMMGGSKTKQSVPKVLVKPPRKRL